MITPIGFDNFGMFVYEELGNVPNTAEVNYSRCCVKDAYVLQQNFIKTIGESYIIAVNRRLASENRD